MKKYLLSFLLFFGSCIALPLTANEWNDSPEGDEEAYDHSDGYSNDYPNGYAYDDQLADGDDGSDDYSDYDDYDDGPEEGDDQDENAEDDFYDEPEDDGEQGEPVN